MKYRLGQISAVQEQPFDRQPRPKEQCQMFRQAWFHHPGSCGVSLWSLATWYISTLLKHG